MVTLGRVYAIFAVLELDYVSSRIPHRAIVLQPNVFQRVDQSSLHVATLLSAPGSVPESFPATHGVEEELDNVKPPLIRRIDKSPCFGPLIPSLEVWKGSVNIASQDSLSTNSLLSHTSANLAYVET